ncbi:V-type proton ATPase subunit e 2-like [Oppia nitens]|uniref:V-type proton ATPase subunit e 2-like n=1 Tax=Oppia nitens TaxID=1686743 RepID=UPI0023DA9FAF|nr:V-type proton ATPase subunit e 2-like [Oppia nitens]XP_054162578.1 V-type proton ATPase subunit e 2-like [Oppia nitens]
MTAIVGPIVITAIWAVVGIVLPFLVPKGPNQGITRTVLVTTAVSCYVLWLCTFIAQLNPLFGPQVSNITLSLMYLDKF